MLTALEAIPEATSDRDESPRDGGLQSLRRIINTARDYRPPIELAADHLGAS